MQYTFSNPNNVIEVKNWTPTGYALHIPSGDKSPSQIIKIIQNISVGTISRLTSSINKKVTLERDFEFLHPNPNLTKIYFNLKIQN